MWKNVASDLQSVFLIIKPMQVPPAKHRPAPPLPALFAPTLTGLPARDLLALLPPWVSSSRNRLQSK